MASYQGPATLIVDEQELQLQLSATSTANAHGIVSWQGSMSAPRVPTIFLNALRGMLRIGDNEADCIISSSTRVGGGRTTVTLALTGSGTEPPF